MKLVCLLQQLLAFVLPICIYSLDHHYEFQDFFRAIDQNKVFDLAMMLTEEHHWKNNKSLMDLPYGPGGQTPLMYATLGGKNDCVEALLLAGMVK